MARRMTEEQVTKAIIRWLIREGWSIIAFDFPQSGTGRALHPNHTESKTEGIWIPDIVAHKGSSLVFFENKSQFVHRDFEKVARLKQTNIYSNAIAEITAGCQFQEIYYGIGFYSSANDINKANANLDMVDFVVLAENADIVCVHYDPFNLFSIISQLNT